MLKVMAGCSYERNDDVWVSGITSPPLSRDRRVILLHFRMYLGIFVMLSVKSEILIS